MESGKLLRLCAQLVTAGQKKNCRAKPGETSERIFHGECLIGYRCDFRCRTIKWLLNLCSNQLLHFNSGQDERPDAFEVVGDNGFANIIIEAPVAHATVARRPAQPGHRAALRERPLSVAVVFDQISNDARSEE